MTDAMNTDTNRILDDLLATMEKIEQNTAAQQAQSGGDAIDRTLASPPRTTNVRSLRDSLEVRAFRQALTDGLIRADTANQLLKLVDRVLTTLL
jgi:hypothetical protein